MQYLPSVAESAMPNKTCASCLIKTAPRLITLTTYLLANFTFSNYNIFIDVKVKQEIIGCDCDKASRVMGVGRFK